jgi:hypothetical protein
MLRSRFPLKLVFHVLWCMKYIKYCSGISTFAETTWHTHTLKFSVYFLSFSDITFVTFFIQIYIDIYNCCSVLCFYYYFTVCTIQRSFNSYLIYYCLFFKRVHKRKGLLAPNKHTCYTSSLNFLWGRQLFI